MGCSGVKAATDVVCLRNDKRCCAEEETNVNVQDHKLMDR